ncbi:hypothetical protein GCM10011521_14610 [Arenimonas soli]|uniref:DUF4340 domain-containing protein n=1 Tax=Arenimonas soli TaxID=2269504 RepID=A0ABQ1HH14_9GAMM|nr:DUF4340 domain-containing protein [Arenimonas soli]GGA77395.1 hypothetical protein GCM10011521_14610 [Arenimonas soli]
MRTRSLVLLAVVALGLAALATWALLQRAAVAPASSGEALPGFAARIESLQRVEVRGAGDRLLVSLVRRDEAWEVEQHPGWPANQREISRALFRLGEARRIEAKTDQPALHARLGVEDVSQADAKGAELRFEGGGDPLGLVVGRNHPGLGGSYVRVAGEDASWLIDADLSPARDPVAWLDRRLLDLPLARTERVRISPASGRDFSLERDGDSFVVRGAPAGGSLDAQATATAAVPEQLALDGLAQDDGHEASLRHVYETVDGLRLEIASWQDEAGTWARLSLDLDEDAATAWFDQAGEDAEPSAERLARLRGQVQAWQGRFEGRKFLLPSHKAANLLKSRADHLVPR